MFLSVDLKLCQSRRICSFDFPSLCYCLCSLLDNSNEGRANGDWIWVFVLWHYSELVVFPHKEYVCTAAGRCDCTRPELQLICKCLFVWQEWWRQKPYRHRLATWVCTAHTGLCCLFTAFVTGASFKLFCFTAYSRFWILNLIAE